MNGFFISYFFWRIALSFGQADLLALCAVQGLDRAQATGISAQGTRRTNLSENQIPEGKHT
jgi:hypothetical protein